MPSRVEGTKRTAGLRSRLRPSVLALVAGALLAPGGMARAELALGTGDSLRMSILGFPEVEFLANVDEDGNVFFPVIGELSAAGQSISELSAEARRAAQGRVFKRYTADGILVPIPIDAEDVLLEVAEYQPVTVSGEVETPQQVPYRPGLTVRAALAIAGGVGRVAGAGLGDVTLVARTQSDYDELVLENARARARIWRLNAQIDSDPDAPVPAPETVRVPEALFAAMLNEERQILESQKAAFDEQVSYLRAAIGAAEERLAILRQQEAQEEAAVAADEEELSRINDLVERGLMQATRGVEVRRALLFSYTRRLDTQNNIARTETEILALKRELNSLSEIRRAEWLEELSNIKLVAMRSGARLSSLQGMLELYGSGVLALSQGESYDTRITVHRRQNGAIVEIAATEDDPLLPGDVLEVAVEISSGMLADF